MHGTISRLKYRHLLAIAWVSSLVYIEWMSYLITAVLWTNLPPKTSDSVRVLLVSDAQIIGDNNEPFPPIGTIIRWDADRYLSTSFNLALSKVLPDVVIFLGDQMDEGSVATSEQFHYYVDRLLTIYAMTPNIKCMFVMGDNDVGGEGRDLITEEKLMRFKEAFTHNNHLQVRFVSFFKINQLSPEKYDFPAVEKGQIRILLSHIPVVPFYTSRIQKLLGHYPPHFIFSGHEHTSILFIGKNNESVRVVANHLEDGSLHTFPMYSDNRLREVVVPTCSYRMGKKNMGFGAAQIDSNGSLHYVVLWLPSRFPKLFIYLTLLAFTSIVLIMPLIRLIRYCLCALCRFRLYLVQNRNNNSYSIY